MMESSFEIKAARREDCEILLKFINDLAIFEKAAQEVSVTAEELQRDGFSDPRRFEALIVWQDKVPVAMAIYYHRYSTWKGLSLYLEDLYVDPEYREQGIASALMKYLCKAALARGCARFEWQVLDWNDGAIKFYKNMNASLDEEWINCRMVNETMHAWLGDCKEI